MWLSNVSANRKTGGIRAEVLAIPAIIILALLIFQGRRAEGAPVFNLEGFLDGANCIQIVGWAWDSSQPNTPINVDIYGDNVLIATVTADSFRQDLVNAGKGNGVHGFIVATPAGLQDGQPHSVRVKFANTNIDLTDSPRSVTCGKEGVHENADCSLITGWAWDPNQPNTPINVDVYLDNDTFRSILAPANQFRQDLVDAGKGNGVHGFGFPTPDFLKDGQPHSIRVKFTDTTIDLATTPRSINCATNPQPHYGGYHDIADCSVIAGWAWDSNQPNSPISVDIYNRNVLIATVVANLFRQDLLVAGVGNGAHGFVFPTPLNLKDGSPHLISVGFHDTSQGLINTPQTISCATFEGFHDGADCTQISGWAWDTSQPNTPISVDIFSDGVLVTTVPANQFRQDLLDAGRGNGVHGFNIPTPVSLKDGLPHSILVRVANTGVDLNNTPKNINCP